MQRVSVTFEISIPQEATREQVEEWLEYELGQRASIHNNIITLWFLSHLKATTFGCHFKMPYNNRSQTLLRLLQVLNILTLEAVTALDLVERTGLQLRTVYRYIRAIEEVFTVNKIKKVNFGVAYKIGPIPENRKGK
jgi:hypothetical protein